MVDWTGDVGSNGADAAVDEVEDPTTDEGSDDATDPDETGAVGTDGGAVESTDEVDESSEVTAAIETAAQDATDPSSTAATIRDGPSPADTPNADTAETGGSDRLLTSDLLGRVAPDAIDRDDAVRQDPRWTWLVWGDEGTGKSHFAHTAPEPICYLDTEGKAANLAEKFDREVVYFDATDYDKARSALVQSMDLLGEVRREHYVVGTIVVDSMSKLWEFAQQKHVDEHFVTKESPEDVTFKSGLQGGDDWKKIKKYHNARFRDVLADCPYHVVMTAMAEEDYNAVMEGAEGKPMKPQGEKNNPYAVENILRLRAAESGDTVGDLLKTDRTRLRFRGMEWPEFPDAIDAVERLKASELSADDVDVSEWPYEVVRGSPAAATTEDDDE